MIAGTIYLDSDYRNVLIPEVLRTANMLERMRGLLGRPSPEKHQALLIVPCSSIHTFFMDYPLDLAFLDKHWQITRLIPSIKPWRMAWAPGSAMVLEMQANTMENMSLSHGQTLYWKENDPL